MQVHFNHYHKLVFFANGYGASVICHQHSYEGTIGSRMCMNGYFEVAVITGKPDDYQIDYNTPITDDVLTNQDFEEVAELLKKIAKLPKRQ